MKLKNKKDDYTMENIFFHYSKYNMFKIYLHFSNGNTQVVI